MKLFTKAQREKLLANGTRRGADHKPVVKLFNPTGAGTWLLTELDPDHPDDYGFGLADLGMGFPELGEIGVREISEYRGLMGLGIERDMYFRPKYAISIYAEAARAAGRIVEFGPEIDAAAGPRPTPAPDRVPHTAFRPVPASSGAGRFRFPPDLGDLE